MALAVLALMTPGDRLARRPCPAARAGSWPVSRACCSSGSSSSTRVGSIARRRSLRLISFALVVVDPLSARLTATVLLLVGLLEGSAVTAETRSTSSSPAPRSGSATTSRSRCSTGSSIPAGRSRGPSRCRAHPDLAFPQQLNPELAKRRLAPGVHRLPVRRLHQRERVQPDRHDADDPLGEDRDGVAGPHLVRDHRAGHRPRGELCSSSLPMTG